jgi:arylsulfatase A-like enzyme
MMRNIRDENLAAWPRTEGVIRSQLAEYYALMSHLDAQIGRILKTLEETGQARNTIIVFAADNGLDVPQGFEGKSLQPLLSGRQTSIRDTVFLPFLDIQRAIRDERYKLIGYPKIGHLQLFDLQADPHETRNLIDDPALQPRVAHLRQRLAEWQTRLGDKVQMPLTNTAPAKVDLSGQPRQPDQWQPQWIIDKYFGPQ